MKTGVAASLRGQLWIQNNGKLSFPKWSWQFIDNKRKGCGEKDCLDPERRRYLKKTIMLWLYKFAWLIFHSGQNVILCRLFVCQVCDILGALFLLLVLLLSIYLSLWVRMAEQEQQAMVKSQKLFRATKALKLWRTMIVQILKRYSSEKFRKS